MKKLNNTIIHSKNILSTKLPNHILETRVSKLFFLSFGLCTFCYCIIKDCNTECKGTADCTNFTWHSPAAPVMGSSCFLFSSCQETADCYSCFRLENTLKTLFSIRLKWCTLNKNKN